MAQRQIIFDPHSLLMLLVHYNDGKDIPLDVKLTAAGVHPLLDRMIALETESKEWGEETTPLQVRFEGQKMLTWEDTPEMHEKGQPVWDETPDAPRQT